MRPLQNIIRKTIKTIHRNLILWDIVKLVGKFGAFALIVHGPIRRVSATSLDLVVTVFCRNVVKPTRKNMGVVMMMVLFVRTRIISVQTILSSWLWDVFALVQDKQI